MNRLNAETEHAVWELFHKVTYVSVAKDSFLAMVLKCPAVIRMESLPMEESEELKYLLKTYWLPWKRDMYMWLKMFGICPWYFKKLRGTPHKYPVVPKFGSGHISTYLSNRHEQRFKWTWMNGKDDSKMHFETNTYAPTIFGEIVSPIVSLLEDYRSLKIARKALETAWQCQAQPQHILEFKPTIKYNDQQDALIRFGDWDNWQERKAETDKAMRGYAYAGSAKVKNAQNTVQNAIRSNRDAQTGRARKQTEVENANILKNIVPLPPDFIYKTAATPNVHVKLDELQRALDARASAIMDFPIQMMGSSGKTSAQAQNNLRNVNERAKSWITYFEDRTKNAFLLGYGDAIQGWINGVNTFVESGPLFTIHQELCVEMPCTPVVSYDDLQKYVTDGIMSKDDFAKHAYEINALPNSQIVCTTE